MAREVNRTQSYPDKIVKLIPTEIVGAYMALAGIVGIGAPGGTDPDSLSKVLIQIVFFALVILTPLYLWKASGVHNILQLIVTTVAFIIWIYTLGGPFEVWGIYEPRIAALILILWSIAIPLIVRPAK